MQVGEVLPGRGTTGGVKSLIEAAALTMSRRAGVQDRRPRPPLQIERRGEVHTRGASTTSARLTVSFVGLHDISSWCKSPSAWLS